jgi:hypothetical protein
MFLWDIIQPVNHLSDIASFFTRHLTIGRNLVKFFDNRACGLSQFDYLAFDRYVSSREMNKPYPVTITIRELE